MTNTQHEALGVEVVKAVDAEPPVSAVAIADGYGFSCLFRGCPPASACRQPVIFYSSLDLRELEWEVAQALAQHKLDERGEPYDPAARDRVARAIMLPADGFLADVRESRADVAALMRVHRYVPERVIHARMLELCPPRLSLVVPGELIEVKHVAGEWPDILETLQHFAHSWRS